MVPIAKIFTENEHPVKRNSLDPEALSIISRLKGAGYEAYVVGGAVRDLLKGQHPKDFDISTSAHPNQIKRLFRNSRVIGRRFRLVHIHFSGGKIIEVSTFRADDENGSSNNVFGSLEEDVRRRDFSINALYLDPEKMQIIDFVDGVRDIRTGRMKSLLPLEETFKEDPVRMIRAVKYSVSGGYRLPWSLKRAIRRDLPELARCPSSRMTEEVFKVLASGRSKELMDQFYKNGLLLQMLPRIDALLKGGGRELRGRFLESLLELDEAVTGRGETRKGLMLMALISPFIQLDEQVEDTPADLFMETYRSFKQLLEPITPPNFEVEMAVVKLFRKKGLRTPKNVGRKPNIQKSEGAGKEREPRKRRSRRRRKPKSEE